MPFCPNCGSSLDSSALYCVKCGSNLSKTEQPSTHSSMKEKGGALEDSIADYFRRMGFDVQLRQRMRDRFDVSHEIDVLASKRESFGTIQIAAECKYVRTPIDIKEVRNFHDKLTTLGITKGIFVSTGGFTADAEAHASALGVELWDDTTLQNKLAESEIPQRDVIHDALAFNPSMISVLSPRHLRNANVFSESVSLCFKPYYFLDYHCFSQHTVAGNVVDIESKGKVIMDGVNGQIVDSRTLAGEPPTLPSNGPFVGCLSNPMETVATTNLPAKIPVSVISHKLDSTRAKDLVKIELMKNISRNYTYSTTRTVHTKHLKPKKKDVDVLNVQLVKIPLLTGTYQYKNYTYTRICVAPTGLFLLDHTAGCTICRKSPRLVCENCGGVACESHGKKCLVCGKNLCSNCVISKGIISKKHYCIEHQPKD